MKLSVIISCYNAEKLISKCLSALRNQSFTDIEIIVVDADSTDNTRQIIKNEFPSVLLIHKENIGVGAALNVGLKNATGDVLVIDYNTDEVADTLWAENLIDAHRESCDKTVISPARLRSDGKVGAYGLNINKNGSASQVGYGEEYNPERRPERVDATGINTFKRSLLSIIGGVDEDYYFYGADVDFSTRARYAGYKVVTEPSAYTVHERSASKSFNTIKYYERMNYGIMRFALLHASWKNILYSIGYYSIFMPTLSIIKIILDNIKLKGLTENYDDLVGRLSGASKFLQQFPLNYLARTEINKLKSQFR